MKRHAHKCTRPPSGPISRKELFSQGLESPFGIADEIVVADVVQVGAGSAGAPYAKLRTDDRSVSLHLIESGKRELDNPLIQSTSERGAEGGVDSLSEYHHYYPADPRPFQVPIHNPPLFGYTKGNGWGGGGVHYYLVMVRGTPALYNSWVACSGNPLWSYDSVLPSLRYFESYTTLGTGPVNTTQRGVSGPLTITRLTGNAPDNTFISAMSVIGVVYTQDYNDPSQGVYVAGDVQQSARYESLEAEDGVTQYSATAFLNESVVTVNEDGDGVGVGGRQLFIDSESYAIRLLFEDDFDLDSDEFRAIDAEFGLGWASGCARCGKRSCRCSGIPADRTVRGVRYISQDRIIDALARERVVLSAGSIGDVEILERSGIGPRELLEQIGIDVRLDQPNVGRNFQNHFAFPVTIAMGADPPGFMTAFLPGSGSGPDGIRQYQLIGGGSLGAEGNIGFIVVDLQPAPVGTVELRTRAFPGTMLIRFNPLTDAADQAGAIEVLKQIGRVAIAYDQAEGGPGRLPILPPPELYPNDAEFGPFGGLAPDDSALLEYAISTGSFLNHDSGSVRMSTSSETGVVDGNLDVWGVANLSIADCGVICNIEDGNTAISCFVVGMQKAKFDGAPVPF